MKFLKSLLSIAVIFALIFSSCTKDGSIGLKGDTGLQGPVGPAGPSGTAGQNGSVIYSGNGSPLLSTGENGDFYLDLSSGALYGPKSSAGWGDGLSLKGSAGATGAAGAIGATGATGSIGATGTAGSQIFNGAGEPLATLGSDGDYYLDKINYLLYGPKSSGVWNIPVNLRGPSGPQGIQGLPGNMNVIIDSILIKNTDWDYPTLAENIHYADFASGNITRARVENDAIVITFYVVYNPNQRFPLGYIFSDGGSLFCSYAYLAASATERVYFEWTNLSKTSMAPSDLMIKYAIIPPAGVAYAKAHNINIASYEEVKNGFHFK